VLPALEPRRIEGRLVATGAIDMKGGFAALLGALDLLAARGVAPPHLELVAVPDEEVGGALSRRLTRERGAEARALWVLEPGELAGESETLVLGRRGLFDWRVEVRGRAAHSGLAFWQGRSAVAAAARWAARAAELSEPGAGPTVNVARLVAGDSAFVGDLAAAATLVGSGRQLNLVGDRATLEGEARFLSLRDAERTDEALRRAAAEIAEREGVELDYRRGLSIPPVEPTPSGREVAALAVGAARQRGWTLEVEEERGGVSFPNFLPDPASLPVLDGLGPAGGGMHTREEWVSLRSLARRIVLLADLLAAAG
jgi:glutamate carboxypeptidase